MEDFKMADNKGMSFLKEFRDFAMKGNVLDMAIGVVIGGAFGKIVSSLVADVITPLIGLTCGGVDFKSLGITLAEKTETSDAVVLSYGVFLQNIFDFVIIAFAIFLSMKLINKMKRSIVKEKKQEDAAEAVAEPSEDVKLLTEIRDLLKSQQNNK